MMTKNKQNSAKHRLLNSALTLFHKQGIAATSVDQILQHSDTGKGQFYYYFQNKDDLILNVMQQFFQGLQSNQIGPIDKLKTWKDLELWFMFFVQAMKNNKCNQYCPIATMASEFTPDQSNLKSQAVEIFDFSRQHLIEFFKHMRQAEKIAKQSDPQALADFCYTIMQGGMLVSRIRNEIKPFENSVKHALKYIKSLKI